MSTVLFEQSAITSGGMNVVRRFGGSSFMSLPTDTPANTPYLPLITSAGSFERHCWSKGSTTGRSSAGFGTVRVANHKTDAGVWLLDDYAHDSVDGQPFIIRLGDGISLATTPTYVTGICKQVIPGWNYLDYVLNDQISFLYDLPLQTVHYLGTNSGATGLEGLTTDIYGNPKPMLVGAVQNISPIPVNTTALVYQVDDGGAKLPMTLTVYSSRNVVTAGTQRTTLALLIANTPAGSTYDWYAGPEGWYFKLGGGIVGRITCDVSEGAAADRTAAQCVSRLLTRRAATATGYTLPTINGITALDSKSTAEVGCWIANETTIGATIDPLLAGVGAYIADTRLTGLVLGRLEDPAALNSAATFSDWQFLSPPAFSAPSDTGIGLRVGSTGYGNFANNAIYSSQGTIAGLPVWRVMLDYAQNYTIMTKSDLPADTDADIAFTIDQFRTAIASDTTILASHLKAPEFDITTLLRYQSDAQAEATRQLGLRKVNRIIVSLQVESAYARVLELGSCFTVQTNRFGWNAGRNFICLGLAETFGEYGSASSTTIIGWGTL